MQIIDLSIIESLKKVEKDQGHYFVEALIDIYIITSSTRLSDLVAAAEGKDVVKLTRTAHDLRSSSANLGLLKVTELCTHLERWPPQTPLEDAQKLLSQLKNAMAEATAQLKALKKS